LGRCGRVHHSISAINDVTSGWVLYPFPPVLLPARQADRFVGE